MKVLINWIKSEEDGQGMVEYGLIILVVAIFIIGSVELLGDSVVDMFTKAHDSIP